MSLEARGGATTRLFGSSPSHALELDSRRPTAPIPRRSAHLQGHRCGPIQRLVEQKSSRPRSPRARYNARAGQEPSIAESVSQTILRRASQRHPLISLRHPLTATTTSDCASRGVLPSVPHRRGIDCGLAVQDQRDRPLALRPALIAGDAGLSLSSKQLSLVVGK